MKPIDGSRQRILGNPREPLRISAKKCRVNSSGQPQNAVCTITCCTQRTQPRAYRSPVLQDWLVFFSHGVVAVGLFVNNKKAVQIYGARVRFLIGYLFKALRG